MSLIMSLFLGLVQGIAEFLPISSSGHLSILQNLMKINDSQDGHLFFDVLLHLGTLVSIIVVYRADIHTMLADGVDFLRTRSDSDKGEPIVLRPPARALLFVIIGTLPMFLVLFFNKAVERLFLNTAFIGFALIITGGLLFVSEKYIIKGNRTEKTMTIFDALIIGLAQAVAVLPGLSRSGTTITVGLSRGLSSSFAVRFSLLLSIPAVLGATLLEFISAVRSGVDLTLIPVYLAGAIFAAIIGFFTIQLLRRITSKGGFGKFAYYCWGVGALALVLTWVLP